MESFINHSFYNFKMDEIAGFLDSLRPLTEAVGIGASHVAIHYSIQTQEASNIMNSYLAGASEIAPYTLGLVLVVEVGCLARRGFSDYMKENGLI